MDYEDLLDVALVGLMGITAIMSLVNGFATAVSRTNCLVPVFLQLGLLGVMFVPRLHGFPSEWFKDLVLVAVWSLCAAISSFRLFRSPVRISKLLGIAQFAEGVFLLFSTAVGYLGSCYAYPTYPTYGHFVWTP